MRPRRPESLLTHDFSHERLVRIATGRHVLEIGQLVVERVDGAAHHVTFELARAQHLPHDQGERVDLGLLERVQEALIQRIGEKLRRQVALGARAQAGAGRQYHAAVLVTADGQA